MSRPQSPSSAGAGSGRYRIFDAIASGGMARVHLGRMIGAAGFSRLVAIKKLHPHLAAEPKFVSMFMDEARLAARVRHPHVVAVLDVVEEGSDLLLVLEYVPGETLSGLVRLAAEAGEGVPIPIAVGIMIGALTGLHAAHDATSENGQPLGIVHRDVSPQNIIVGSDGLARVLDFGIAYAAERLHLTRGGELKGKLAYMAPEQLGARESDRRTDLYAAGIVLWELLAGRPLFRADTDAATLDLAKRGAHTPPSAFSAQLPPALDAAVMRALAREPSHRFASARDFALALEAAAPPAPHRAIAEWVERVAGASLTERARLVARIEASDSGVSERTQTELAVALSPAATAVGAATVAGASASITLPAAESPSVTHAGVATKTETTAGRDAARRWLVPLGSAVVGAVLAGGLALALTSRPAVPDTMRDDGTVRLRAHASELTARRSAPAIPSPPATATIADPDEEAGDAPPIASDAPALKPTTTPRPRTPSAKPTKANCTPPFTVDKDGVRIPKPECF